MFTTLFRAVASPRPAPVLPAPAPQQPAPKQPALVPPTTQPALVPPTTQSALVPPLQQQPTQTEPPAQQDQQPAAVQSTGPAPVGTAPAGTSSSSAPVVPRRAAVPAQNQTLAAIVIASARPDVTRAEDAGQVDDLQRARQFALNAQAQYRRMALIEALTAPPQHVALHILSGPTRRDDGAGAVVPVGASGSAAREPAGRATATATVAVEGTRLQQRR